MTIPNEIISAILSSILAVVVGALAWTMDKLLKLTINHVKLSARLRFLELQHRKRGLLDSGKSDTDFLKS